VTKTISDSRSGADPIIWIPEILEPYNHFVSCCPSICLRIPTLARAAGPLIISPTGADGSSAHTRRARGRGRGGRGGGNRNNKQEVLPPSALLKMAWKDYRDQMSKAGDVIPGWKRGDNWTRYLSHISSVFATVVSGAVVELDAFWWQTFAIVTPSALWKRCIGAVEFCLMT
jgi:hypothetical protein